MLKLTFNTLVGLFLVLVIFGRSEDISAPPASVKAAALPDETPLIQQASMVTPAAAETAPATAPRPTAITPAFPKATIGPALRSSPQYRDSTPVAAEGATVWRVTAGALNVRTGPAASYERVDSVTRGEEVQLVAERGSWAKIRVEGDGIDGWVSKRFLTPSY